MKKAAIVLWKDIDVSDPEPATMPAPNRITTEH